MTKEINWLSLPEAHDYPAAQDYLSLLFPDEASSNLVRYLRNAPIVYRKAKDILRASMYPLLSDDNHHVHKNLKKIEDETPLSPILLVRSQQHLIIADGYHRVCAVYLHDEDAQIPCKLV
jgi:hypothetical protein